MNIVIIGMGMIGKSVLKNLSKEGHDVTIIDEDRLKVEKLIEKFDVLGVVGNGACKDILLEAKVNLADFVIVVTNSDEVNILSCLVAKRLGAKNTIARVRNPEYRAQVEEMKEELGLSMIVNPEKETADEIFKLITLPSIAQIEHFAKGMVSLVEILVDKNCSLVNETLFSLGKKIKTKVLICAVQRGDKVIIPTGNFEILEGDRISFTAETACLGDFLEEINMISSPLKKVMIVGGGRIGYYLSEELINKKFKVKLIESDLKSAEEMATRLPKLKVVNGDGTDHALLVEEGVGKVDAFVTMTGNDEENIIASMFANKQNVKKAITLVKSDGLSLMLGDLGINNYVSPKSIVADKIVTYVRAKANKRGSKILTLYHLVKGQVEALEFKVNEVEPMFDKPLRALKIKNNCLVACIIRNNMVIIPDGNSYFMPGDNVIVVTTHKNFNDLTDLFVNGGK